MVNGKCASLGKCFGIVNSNSVSLVLKYIKTKTNRVKQTSSSSRETSDLDVHWSEDPLSVSVNFIPIKLTS